MKNDNYHLGQLNGPVSQIDIQRNMVGFVMDSHIFYSQRGGLYARQLLMCEGDIIVGFYGIPKS